MSIYNVISEKLGNKNKVIRYKSNSVLNAIMDGDNESMVKITSKIASTVKNDVTRYREKFIPVIQEYVTLINSRLGNINTNVSYDEYNVIEVAIPLYILELKTNLKLYNTPDGVTIPVADIVIDMEDDKVYSLLKTANPITNAQIDEVIATAGLTKTEVLVIVNNLLANVSGSNSYLSKLLSNALFNMSELAILRAVLLSLLETKPDSVKVPEDVYNTTVTGILHGIENAIYNAISKYDDYYKTETLVIGYSSETSTLKVHSDLYKEFIQNNTVEVLLGLAIRAGDNLPYNKRVISDITGNTDSYLEAWKKHVALVSVKRAAGVLSDHKAAYSLAMVDLIQHIPEDVKEYIMYDLKEVSNIIPEHISARHSDAEIRDVVFMAKDIVKELVFTKGNFRLFVDYMDSYTADNSDIEPAQAATLASLDLIVDYIIGQLELVSV